jgi:hypothetical protein
VSSIVHAPWSALCSRPRQPPVKPPVPPSPSSPRLRVLHISDLHYDPLYTPGLSSQCGEPLCCRPPNGPGVAPHIAGYWGDFNCGEYVLRRPATMGVMAATGAM